MADHLAEIDACIGELERARNRLAKTKAKQIRGTEDREALKAVALSWFRSHRPLIAAAAGESGVDDIDDAYRTLMDATDRASATSTYREAIRSAKAALVAARGRTLVAAPDRTANSAPDFSPLASDATMRQILARRWHECTRCLDANAPLAATVMMGGLLEALFVSRANRLADKSPLFVSKAAPIDPKTKKALDLRQWTLAPYIDVGHDLGWISRSAKDVAVVLRDYRNYVHPEKERSHGVVLTNDDAAMFWEVSKSLSRELLSLKGKI